MEAADIFVTYEQAAASYHEFRPAAFMMHYPKTMFWHMIYAARADTSDATLQRFKQQHAGWLYLTDLDLDNPYKDLPQEAIWQLQVDQSFSAAGHSQPHVAAGQSHGAAGQDQDVPGGLYQRLHCIWQTQLDSVKLHLARLSPA